MTRSNLADTLDAPLVRPTTRNCRLDLRVVPAPKAAPAPEARPERGLGRRTLARLGVSIIALELVVAGALRLGVGAPDAASAPAAVAQVAQPASARSLSSFDAPTAHPAVAVTLREKAEQIAAADLAPAHLAERPTGFGTF